MAVVQTGDNKWAVARYIVDQTPGQGTHTTIAAAMADAVSGDVIAVRQGTYTENFTMTPGVTLTTMGGGEYGGVTVVGKVTMTAAGTSVIFGMRLQTNSDFAVAVTGSAASILVIENSFINCTNNTGISFTSSSASAQLYIDICSGNLGTTGISFISHSSAGRFEIVRSSCGNSGGSTTASTCSSGILNANYFITQNSFTFSGTSFSDWDNSRITPESAGLNTTALTAGGSGVQKYRYCTFESGTASAISIDTTASLESCIIKSSNANAITGAGTLNLGIITFEGSSSTINPSITQSSFVTRGGSLSLNTALTVPNGGSGVASFANTSALLASGTTTTGALQNIASVATGQVLVSAGTSTLPAWSATPSVTSITVNGGTALDDYVEGTFSPTLIGATTAGVQTYTLQVGYYSRIGNKVYVTGSIATSANSGTGLPQIANLPFTVLIGTGFQAITTNYQAATPANTTYVNAFVTANTTVAPIYGIVATTGGITSPAVVASATVYFNGFYPI